jgi:hypothetical protein
LVPVETSTSPVLAEKMLLFQGAVDGELGRQKNIQPSVSVEEQLSKLTPGEVDDQLKMALSAAGHEALVGRLGKEYVDKLKEKFFNSQYFEAQALRNVVNMNRLAMKFHQGLALTPEEEEMLFGDPESISGMLMRMLAAVIRIMEALRLINSEEITRQINASNAPLEERLAVLEEMMRQNPALEQAKAPLPNAKLESDQELPTKKVADAPVLQSDKQSAEGKKQ